MKLSLLSFAALVVASPLVADELRIDEMLFDAQGRPRFSFNARPDSYYVLLRGNAVLGIVRPAGSPAGMIFGRLGARLRDPYPATTQGYFKLREVPFAQPLDLDGDGVDDIREVLSNSDPLDRNRPAEPCGPGGASGSCRGGEPAGLGSC